jgi:hypothetical protein
MTDLLDRLADVNPVPRCDPPSIDDVWRKLDAPADELAEGLPHDGRVGGRSPIPTRRGGLLRRGVRTLPALAGVAVCLVVVIVAVTGPRSHRAPSGGGGGAVHSGPGWNATDGRGPSLSALMAHFAVLRRPPTAADRAARRENAFGVGTAGKTEYPTFARHAGDANGIPIDFVVDADHRHGATGPVVSYSMSIGAGEEGLNYIEGNYTIFPTVVSTASGPQSSEYLSAVPDGVRTVTWRFACPTSARGCVLPAGRHTVSVPVRHNLAVYAVPRLNPGTFDADAVSVTWDRDDGTSTTFTDQNTAVPFAGAPAQPAGRTAPAQRYAAGNGPSAGEPLTYWRSRYGVFRRPQDARDRLAVAKAESAKTAPFVPSLTRVVLDTDHALVFITLGSVNPAAGVADRRYVATVWAAALPTGSMQWNDLTPGVQQPSDVILGSTGSIDYSVVPDDVTKVSWQYKCTGGCGEIPSSPLMLRAHSNVAYFIATPSGNTSWSVANVAWYLRGRTKPLRAEP